MRLLTASTSHPQGFQLIAAELEGMFLDQPLRQRGQWQAQTTNDKATRELNHVVLELPIPQTRDATVAMVEPNLPWAEDHFQERVGGKPLNPPPSSAWWPFAQAGHKDHVDETKKFSHTYPERMWPKHANPEETMVFPDGREAHVNVGIRYAMGDLSDLVETLVHNPHTRQAYLPIWFPEDTFAARSQLRVPCTIGYHFLLTEDGLDCTYHIRSCDYMRHFRDDVYMAMRLTQWVVAEYNNLRPNPRLVVGKLYMHIANFHTFEGDDAMLQHRVGERGAAFEIRGGR